MGCWRKRIAQVVVGMCLEKDRERQCERREVGRRRQSRMSKKSFKRERMTTSDDDDHSPD